METFGEVHQGARLGGRRRGRGYGRSGRGGPVGITAHCLLARNLLLATRLLQSVARPIPHRDLSDVTLLGA